MPLSRDKQKLSMTDSERWQQIKEVLHRALQVEADAQPDFLSKACGDDESLRKEVETLLATYGKAEGCLETPATDDITKLFTDNQGESLVGQSLGPYRVLSQLGVGGMGEVYLAEDIRLHRKIALKLLPPYFIADPERVPRFRREARSASALNHPNIITIYEIGKINNRYFIATEFIEGETLRQRMANCRMQIEEVIDISIQVASALAEAHAAGIIHRDIKPENIMVRAGSGLVKVLDFGLAKLTEKSLTQSSDPSASTVFQTNPNVVMGTARYMSPEQARGMAVDARTDIWSLGVVLYEVLAGHAPFEGETSTDVIISILQKEPAPLSVYTQEVPSVLENIVRKALEKECANRYQTAEEILVDVKSLKRELERATEMGPAVLPATSAEAAQMIIPSESNTAAEPIARQTRSAALELLITRRKRGAIIIALATLLLAIAGYVGRHFLVGSTPIKSLAVLPLVNTSGDPEVDYLSDGIAESLINSLSHLPNVKVMSRNSVARYKGKEVDPQTVGRELGVETVLTGRVVERADDLTISVELVDTRDNSHIWGEQYNRKLSDLLAVQLEISREVSEKLRLPLTGEEQQQVAKRYTENPEAYQLFLKGRYYTERRTKEYIERAVKYFQQATEKDPRYALAYAELGNAYLYLGDYEVLPPKENYLNVKSAVMKALEIDNTLGEAHAQLGDLLHRYEWDWAGAEREFKRAIELNPNYAEAHHIYSHYLLERGRVAESLAESKWNLELDPLSTATNLHLGWHYLYARQYDEAIEQERKTLEIDPNYARAHQYLAHAYEQKQMFDDAVAEYLKSRILEGGSPEEAATLKAAYASAGMRSYWQRALELLLEKAKTQRVSPYNIAALYSRLGDKGKALEMLERAYAEHSTAMVGLNLDFEFDRLRSEPRFKDLVRRVGLPE
jgi:eukaryotic-like serine/threonine-protein kinase